MMNRITHEKITKLEEEVRRWKDRYSSLFSWAVVAALSECPDMAKWDDAQREIYHRWYGEVHDG
jgi:hypothetical protein